MLTCTNPDPKPSHLFSLILVCVHNPKLHFLVELGGRGALASQELYLRSSGLFHSKRTPTPKNHSSSILTIVLTEIYSL